MLIALSLIHFWLRHPALLYGIAFLLGVSCHFEGSICLIVPCLSLWLPFLIVATHPNYRDVLKHLSLSLLTFFTAFSISTVHYSFPLIPKEGIPGKGYVKIHTISLQHTMFGERWLYRCELKQFFAENNVNSIITSLPCLISLPEKDGQLRPRANQDYWVSGKLLQNEKEAYILKVSSKALWMPIQGSWSWAEQRYQWKKKVSQWIESQFSHALSASFLAGLATGEFDDFWMRQQFARFGLQHLLAISGFHFSIIAGFLSFVMHLFLSRNIRIVCLLICLGGYCFFLGSQASILRAWIMCSLTLLGSLIDKQSTALNSLGFALLLILGYNPLLCQELGFQLSFATTAAILLFYQPAQAWLYHLFPRRRLSQVIHMNCWNQHAYCILAFLRSGLALTLAVNTFALPLTLYHFHQFPWMSLLYNLFYPFLVSGSICLLLLGGLLSFFPFLAENLHRVNDAYTFFLLQLTYQIPSGLDIYLILKSMSSFWLIFYICCISIGGIIWRERHLNSSRMEEFSLI
jgi:competence protein ComEC